MGGILRGFAQIRANPTEIPTSPSATDAWARQNPETSVRKQTKEKYIELSALKTIVAFLNTEGGVLLLGVSDDGNIPGIGIETEVSGFRRGLAAGVGGILRGFAQIRANPTEIPTSPSATDAWARQNPETSVLK